MLRLCRFYAEVGISSYDFFGREGLGPSKKKKNEYNLNNVISNICINTTYNNNFEHMFETLFTDKKANAADEAMEALAQARQRQAETKHKCQEAAKAETIHSGAIRETFEKAEALEQHVKTVTMRGEIRGDHGGGFLHTPGP